MKLKTPLVPLLLLALAALPLLLSSNPRVLAVAPRASELPLPDKIDFNRDIRPILSDNCYACHGPDKNKRKADLRFDIKEGLFSKHEDTFPVVPGNLEDSVLYMRITADDPEVRMPDPKSNKHLAPREIALIKKWIEQGAPWQGHWAYVKPEKPFVPSIDNAKPAIENPIDSFILEKLKEHNLKPSPEADRATLIRRLSFDLTGLPPTADEVKAFVNDTSPTAYDSLVDRLMTSPHFGERMAVYWLDLVRYADTIGYHSDTNREVYPFRDYVIKSFNENKRFDQFTLEQLAGDLLATSSDTIHAEPSALVPPDAPKPTAAAKRKVAEAKRNAAEVKTPEEKKAQRQSSREVQRSTAKSTEDPNPNRELRVASAYNRLLLTTEEGGAQPKEYEAKNAADRVRNVSSVWLGSTMACCQCHDHKFDPFTTKDFYSMAAFFADIKEPSIGTVAPELNLPDEAQSKTLKGFDDTIAADKKKLETNTPELAAAQAQWEYSVREPESISWTTLTPLESTSRGGATLSTQPDGSILAGGNSPEFDLVTVTTKTDLKNITAIRLEVLPDKSLPAGGPGRGGNGNFVLSEFHAIVKTPDGSELPIPLIHPTATFEQVDPNFATSITQSLRAKKDPGKIGWAILGRIAQPSHAIFETAPDLTIPEGSKLLFVMRHDFGQQHTIGHYRFSATTAARPIRAVAPPPDDILTILPIDSEERTKEQKQKVAAYYRGVAPLLDPVRAEIVTTETKKTELLQIVPKTLISVAMDTPRMVRILRRGNWQDEGGDIVQPAIPQFLSQTFNPSDTSPAHAEPRGSAVGLSPSTGTPGEGRGEGSSPPSTQHSAPSTQHSSTTSPTTQPRLTRLDLANWLISKENPLTARVMVNRLWKLYFGQGLSRSLEDLGAQGEWPTHPELLDYLACEFQDGWNVKQMIRLMVTSQTYRQTSTPTKELMEVDPFNKYLARQGRFRLDAEFVRDNALAISGLLSPKIGGKSVKPYQPEGYWEFLNFPKRTWQADKGDSLYRRGMYTHWQRTFLHPSLLNFDASGREECVAQRAVSNTPQQALTLLNDPIYVEAARVFAEHTLKQPLPTPADKIKWACNQALSRDPRPEELKVLADLLEKHRAEFATDKKSAEQLLSIGDAPRAKDLDAAELAAWTSVTRAILNLHETIMRF